MGPALNQRPRAHPQQVDAVPLKPHGYLVVDVVVNDVLWRVRRREGKGRGTSGTRLDSKCLTTQMARKQVVNKVCFGALAAATVGNRHRSSSQSRATLIRAWDTRGSGRDAGI